MVPAGNKAKRLSSVNHTTKIIHHHHHQIEIFPVHCRNSRNIVLTLRKLMRQIFNSALFNFPFKREI